MKTLSKLALLATALTVVSCNESVSPELKSGNSSTPGGGTAPITETFSFSVSNTSPVLLNYKLHKAGPGNMDAKCEVTSPSAFTSLTYQQNLGERDITCFFEAEELSLYYGGMKFKYEASPNACEFVSYAPFSYYNRLPGDSTASIRKSICGTNVLAPTAGHPACGQYQDTMFAGTTFSSESDAQLCQFNYQDGDKESCDTGTISLTENTFEMTAGPDNTPNTSDDVVSLKTTTTKTIRCGGKPANCIKGAIKQESKLSGATSGALITASTADVKLSKEVSLSALIEQQTGSNRNYVNFRRNLASAEIDYGSSVNLTNLYRNAFSDPTTFSSFDPKVMDLYSSNLKMDATVSNRVIDSTLLATYSVRNNRRGVPLAAEPFLGLGRNSTNPFYTFYCLDAAKEIKARIRMVVRDWDRVIPKNNIVERISDIYELPPVAHQDVPDEVEVSGDPDGYNMYNDYDDWDDVLPMEIVNGTPFDPSMTFWRPAPDGIYVDGYFNPEIFPNEKSN